MSISPKSVFITGANRGLGFGLVKGFLALASPPKHIFATYRSDANSQELLALAAEKKTQIYPIKFDVTDYASLPGVVEQVSQVVGDDGLTMLINNAGVLGREANSLTDVTPEHMRAEIESNAIAPLIITQSLLPLIKKAASLAPDSGLSASRASIVNMSSRVGSCGDNDSGGRYPYRTSKAALNMISKSMSVDLKEAGVLVSVIHPGWVQTEMGGSSALITVQESIKGILDVLGKLDTSTTGQFFHSNGQQLPW